jgi:hypothetical protein
VSDLLISRMAPGLTAVSSVDPFDTLAIYRIDRARWQHTPEQPGIYLLYGVTPDGKLTVYIGMSTTNMRSRIRSHHIDPAKNWFGVLFAVPVSSALLCRAIEAELIGQLTEAGVVNVIANEAAERRHRNAEDVHIEPAVEKIRDGLQLGSGAISSRRATSRMLTQPIRRWLAWFRSHANTADAPQSRELVTRTTRATRHTATWAHKCRRGAASRPRIPTSGFVCSQTATGASPS